MSLIDKAAMFLGYAIMAVAGYSVVVVIIAVISQRLWEIARALGMMVDFRKWYRGNAWYHSTSGDEEAAP